MTSTTPDTPEDGTRADATAALAGQAGPHSAADGTDGRPAVDPPPQSAADPGAAPAGDSSQGAADPGAAPGAAGAAPTDPPADQEDVQRRLVDPSTLRRAPRYGRFIFLGVALGGLVSLALALFSEPSDLAGSDLFWLLFLSLGSIGGLVGAVVAVILDRRSLRRRGLRAPSAGPAGTHGD